MSADDSLSTAEVLRRLKEEMAQQAPRDHKEHHAIETSLSNPYLQSDTKWGFVIVRASYGPSSDTLWAQFLDLFRANVEETLRLEDELDLLPRHEMTIIENEAALGGADSYAARRAFRAWVANDLPQRLRGSCLEELGGLAQVREKLLSNDAHSAPGTTHPASLVPPRWKYCIFVDQDCLRSVEKGPEEPELKDPALKILTTEWEREEAEVPTEEFTRDWDGGETNDDAEEVGWMYMDMTDYVTVYDRLTDAFAWQEYYQRPYKSYVENSESESD
ncbi:hypothetical protein J3E72DRAFT_417423 [Bipolaris maydis]|uniref:uncharacterized protein n=1 Tax=Cochliobolus heterostrophus TaxID=5016 RepID=UPI000326A196|nr:hypothetical protein BM1_08017 [Bipolaris maydis]KAJ5061137.1 hypothetical protein J3E74DRAFT_474225 [Bipolaris maydis]KAJ6198270.1 hypothetical protein J3E72DRAFT_417423 [Bipolaris maydis]KAJ6210405.1 hypothetical protein PSV09DRAFT_2381506 [Bipolaris maydis]KAJ6272063.1 hypothetical protein PSV08DRAFT_400887 [Bipolaris maydis]